MEKKSKLNGFVFKKLDEISNGLQIPTGNAIRQQAPPPPKEFIEEPVYNHPTPVRQQVAKPTSSKPRVAPFRKLDIDNTSFTPMTNIVPTIQPVSVPTNVSVVVPTQEPKYKGLTRRQKQRILPEDLNMSEYGALATKQEKINYLAMRGWSLKEEIRGNTFYHYATKYIKRKKKRFYLGSVNEC